MSVFYTVPSNIAGDSLILTGSEARHIRDVLRFKKGDAIMVADGLGNCFRCEIWQISTTAVTCRIYNIIRHFGEPHHFVTLAAGLSTGFKFDDVVQSATELGVSRFYPLITAKSKIKILEEKRQDVKISRWQKVALASMKQCERAYFPEIKPFIDFKDVFAEFGEVEMTLLFDPHHAKLNLDQLSFSDEPETVNIIVGPESGFSPEEIELAQSKNCHIISIGPRILRTENAAPIAVALVMQKLGELR